jgi:phosphate:Na+ symporter
MDYSFLNFLALLGSLGLFLYGMKLMSEALQKVAGNRLRVILSAMTSNRFAGIITGFLITAIIQSSSATTVMVVSFVNAGLLSLIQSVGVIMGANVGTTATAWLLSFVGFKVNMGVVALPFLAIGVPFIFSKKHKWKYVGECIVGFSLLFMGLDFLKANVPDLQSNPELLSFLQNYTSMGYGSILLFLLVGTILTIIVQSSSATMAITLIMCSQGWISLDIAAAMVLGENIGTTITANLAALSGNVSAKRAALVHFFFNFFGVIWVLIVFYPFLGGVSYIIFGSFDAWRTMDPTQVSAMYALSLFHTMFNIANVLILNWFAKPLVKFVTFILPQKEEEEEEFHLTYISTGMLSTSELSILQASKEIQLYADRSKKMFGFVRQLYIEKNESAFAKLYSRIEKYEAISDRIEVEIADYLTRVSEGRLSAESKQTIIGMLKVVTEIESIGDSCSNMARTILRKHDDAIEYTAEIDNNVHEMFALTEAALDQMIQMGEKADVSGQIDITRSYNLENEINNFRNQIKAKNAQDINSQVYPYKVGVSYMDLIAECEKLGDYILNVVEAIAESKLRNK